MVGLKPVLHRHWHVLMRGAAIATGLERLGSGAMLPGSRNRLLDYYMV